MYSVHVSGFDMYCLYSIILLLFVSHCFSSYEHACLTLRSSACDADGFKFYIKGKYLTRCWDTSIKVNVGPLKTLIGCMASCSMATCSAVAHFQSSGNYLSVWKTHFPFNPLLHKFFFT